MKKTTNNNFLLKYKKIFLVLILFIFILFGTLIILEGGWDNFKLNSVKYWGLFTISNNPIFDSYDEDLKIAKETKVEPRINLEELKSGGPPKDGIPSINDPKFDRIDESPFPDSELVVGVYYNNISRAYPYGILNWHEIVNDNYNGTPIVVTLCPLCDTNPVFIGRVNGVDTTFGVSGKLYHSCLVMYDRLTDTLWSQPWGLGVVGDNTNDVLERIVAHKTTLGEWKKIHPDTKILSTDTGYSRDYFKYPYGTYYTDENLIFNVRNLNQLSSHPKEIISYIWQADKVYSYDEFSGEHVQVFHSYLNDTKEKSIKFETREVHAKWDDRLSTIRFYENGEEIPSSTAFAFVYSAYFG